MSDSRNIKRSQNAIQAAQAAESVEFTGILGSNANPKWFDALMQYSGTYLFTLALFLSVLKLAISIYQYVKSPNKNIHEKVSLGWTVLQTAGISIAIIGALAAATVFALATPALFVATMAADTVRNLGFLFWNIGRLALLRFQVRKSLNGKDPFTELKYEALKGKYIERIQGHAVGLAVGLTMTTAISIIFLFPHIGLGFIGATLVGSAVVGKMTIAGIAGIVAAGVLTIPLLPSVFRLAKRGLPRIGHAIKKGAKSVYSFLRSIKENKKLSLIAENKEVTQEQQPSLIHEEQPENENQQIQPLPVQPMKLPSLILPTAKHSSFRIIGEYSLDNAIEHNEHFGFNAFSLRSEFRETIIDHINDPNLAKLALQKMIGAKNAKLLADIDKSNLSKFSSSYFVEKQQSKRRQKLQALLLIKTQLNQTNTQFSDIMNLIQYIETNIPSVKESFFLEQSDTQNMIEALKVYAYKFLKDKPEENNEDNNTLEL